jgi:autotransporter-associated beta strand protein
MKLLALLSAALVALFATQPVHAGSATWNLNPTNSDWNTANNWTPATVPNGPSDTATFALSNAPDADITTDTEVNGIVFSSGASAATITATAQQVLTISGTGIVNNSGIRQDFVADQDPDGGDGGEILFTNSATAGTGTRFTVVGGQEYLYGIGGVVSFADSSSADHAGFEVFGSAPNAFEAGELSFGGSSTAGNATILLHAGGGYDGSLDVTGDATAGNATVTNKGGFFYFWNSATAGNSTIINDYGPIVFRDSTSADHVVITNNGGTPGRELFNGTTEFWFTASAADAIFINNGGTGTGSEGGSTGFTSDSPTAGNATLIANPGVDGGDGGRIVFTHGDGGTARVEVFGNGTLDVSGYSGIPPLAIGSLEGDGLVSLGANSLTIGGNNLSTTFSGLIQGSSALTKVGRGTLSLTGASSYTEGTTVSGGTLMVGNTIGSATGPGRLKVSAGSLGGTGIIVGPVIVGTGSGRGARLSPGTRKTLGTLTLQNGLTLNPDATYAFILNSTMVNSATVSARGIIINSGALFSAVDKGNATLPVGTTFTAIKNSALHPTTGTFGNLPDASTTTVGSNTFQANYEGGDGNDLTLTVVP